MSPRVFMVEDDPNIVAAVRPVVEKEGLSFAAHGRVAGALEAIRGYKPDLVLLDVELPDGDGFSLCRSLMADPAFSEVPVLFLTARADVASRLKGFESGGRDYVVKPFSVEELCARLRSHLAVKRRQDSLTGAVDELALRERVRQDMADMIVHDLRSPISTVRMTLELLRDSGLVNGTEYARVLGAAEGAVDFVLLMIGDLLDLGAGRVKVEPGLLDLKALASRLEGLVRLQCEHRKVDFKVALSGEAEIRTDATLVFRILANLLFNALKFSRAGGAMAARLEASATGLRVEVTDQGPGVPDSEKEKIFEKYYRISSPEAVQIPGAGVGLAFCRMAAHALGGRIWVEDAPGGGSRFIAELPSRSEVRPAADFFGPEVMAAYAEDCRASLETARALARKIPGPEAEAAAREAMTIAHRLSGSAGTYGFDEAGRLAKELEKSLAGAGALDEDARESLLRALEALGRQLPQSRSPGA